MNADELVEHEYPRQGRHLLERPFRVVDLTREIFEGMPLWFGHQKTFITTNQTHEQFRRIWNRDFGFEAHNLIISEHAGTHADAIFEYDADGPTIDMSPLEFYYGPAICLDVSHVDYPDSITESTLSGALQSSELQINPGDIVLLYTGYGDRHYPDLAYAERHPGLTAGAVEWLAMQGVVNIAIDNVSIDHSDDETFAAHAACGQFGIVNTEGLTNLDQIANRRFTFFGLPLRIRNGTGSPIRAIAMLANRGPDLDGE